MQTCYAQRVSCSAWWTLPGFTPARVRRFDCTSDGSYVEIVHVSLADEAALTGDEDDEAYEGPVRTETAYAQLVLVLWTCA